MEFRTSDIERQPCAGQDGTIAYYRRLNCSNILHEIFGQAESNKEDSKDRKQRDDAAVAPGICTPTPPQEQPLAIFLLTAEDFGLTGGPKANRQLKETSRFLREDRV